MFFESTIPQISLPFMPQNAFEIQMQYIKEYYTTPDPDRVLDRRYPYLNEKILTLFIGETSSAIIRIIHMLERQPQMDFTSSLSLLSAEESASYYPPLGD
jgi:hypothetical protein